MSNTHNIVVIFPGTGYGKVYESLFWTICNCCNIKIVNVDGLLTEPNSISEYPSLFKASLNISNVKITYMFKEERYLLVSNNNRHITNLHMVPAFNHTNGSRIVGFHETSNISNSHTELSTRTIPADPPTTPQTYEYVQGVHYVDTCSHVVACSTTTSYKPNPTLPTINVSDINLNEVTTLPHSAANF